MANNTLSAPALADQPKEEITAPDLMDEAKTQTSQIEDGVIDLGAIVEPVSIEVPQDESLSADARLQGLIKAEEDTATKAREQAEIDAALGETKLKEMTDTEGVAQDFITETQELIDKQIDPQTRRDIEQLNILIAEDEKEKMLLNDAIREGRGVQKSIARGQIARERAILGINIATNMAIKTAKEGKVEDAKEMAKLGMQAKQTAEANALANERTFLQRSYDSLDSARQKEADLRLKKIEKQESDLESIQDIYANAVLNGASPSTLKGIQNAKTLRDAQTVAGTFAMSPAEKASLYASQLTSRSKLLDMALLGDQDAIAQLGYDPTNTPEKQIEELRAQENSMTQANNHLEVVNSLLENESGLRGAVGATPFQRSPIGRGEDKLGVPQAEVRFSDKADFLADVEYIMANMTLDQLGKLEVPLTPVSDADMNKVGSAASVLSGMAMVDKDTNKVTGLKGSEEKARMLIDEIAFRYTNVIDEINATQALSEEELSEIYGI